MNLNIKDKKYSFFIYFTLIFTVVINFLVHTHDASGLLKNLIFCIILGTIYNYVRVYIKKSCTSLPYYDIVSSMVLFISFMLMDFNFYVHIGPLFLLIIVLTALCDELPLAFLNYGILFVFYIILNFNRISSSVRFIEYLIIAFLIIILFQCFNFNGSFKYICVIISSCVIVFCCIICNFDFNQLIKDYSYYMVDIVSIITLLLFAYVLIKTGYTLKYRFSNDNSELSENENTVNDNPENNPLADNSTESPKTDDFHDKIKVLMSADGELMTRLKEDDKLFEHLHRISEISGQAALCVEADEILCLAGGMFHEAGKINSEENSMMQTVRLMEQYEFPERLREIIRQHSVAYELPKTKEAAVVMLTDSIVSTDDYLKSKGKNDIMSKKQLVEGIFKNRIQNGQLAKSGLTEEDIDNLKIFYTFAFK